MRYLFWVIAVIFILACGSSRQATLAPQATIPPTVTRDTLLGTATSLMHFFETQHQFKCSPSGNHFRCTAPDNLVKVVFFGDPVTEATISVPLDAAPGKPSRYVVALLFEAGLGNPAWDWLVSQMEKPEASKTFGDRRLTTQMDKEGWLVTVRAIR